MKRYLLRLDFCGMTIALRILTSGTTQTTRTTRVSEVKDRHNFRDEQEGDHAAASAETKVNTPCFVAGAARTIVFFDFTSYVQ